MRYRALYGLYGSRIRQWQTIQWKTGQWKTGQSAMADNIVGPFCQRMRLMPAYKHNETSVYNGTCLPAGGMCPCLLSAITADTAPFSRHKKPSPKKNLLFLHFFLAKLCLRVYKRFCCRGGGIGRHAVLRWQWLRRAGSIPALDTI